MLSENIQKFRKLRNVSQQDLADKIHVTRQTVSKWERGQSVPDADLLAPIAEALSIQVSDLLGAQKKDCVPEETATCETGTADELAKESMPQKKKLKAWEILLLVLGSPIWLPLLIAASAISLSLYVVLWSAILVLWAVFASFVVCVLAGIAGGVYFAIDGNGLTGIAMIGAGLIFAGLSVFAFFGCKAVTKFVLILSKKLVRRIKNALSKRRTYNE